MALVLLVRHGHSTANAEGVLAGWTDGVGLTDRGRRQAEHLAERLAGVQVARVVSSPLQRCLETAALALPGADVVVDDGLGECRYGAWTGRRLADVAKEPLWRVVQDDPASARFPDGDAFPGETMADMATRVVGAVRAHDAAVEAEHGPGAVWVALSHGDPIKSVVADAVGAGLAGLQRLHVDPGSVTAIRFSASRALVLASNSVEGALAPVSTPPKEHAPGDATVGGGTGGTD